MVDLHRYIVAVSRVVVNHDGRVGTVAMQLAEATQPSSLKGGSENVPHGAPRRRARDSDRLP